MFNKLLISFIFLFVSNYQIFSQFFPDKGILYNDTEVCTVKIEINQDSLNQILLPGNEESDHEYPARFIFLSSEVEDTVENVGFRLRGNTSRYSAKKSFKVSVNSFFGGRKYQGVEKINLNGEHNDPSIIRTKLSFDLFRDLGVPAQRSSHIELYINGEYKGLYINVEHVDEEFVESRFGNKNGNLYKCLWPASLEYISDNPDDYKFTSGERRAYDLKINTELDDYSDLAHFIDILNNTPADQLHLELEPVFNVNSYLKYLAVEVLTGHWDAYSFLKNNYYLYHNTQTDKFEFIPYDLDNTYGIDWFGIDWGVRNIYEWTKQDEYRPLTERLLENQVYKDRFSFFIQKMLNDYFDPSILFPKIDQIKAMITNSAENDIYRTLDYGYSIQDFHDSYDIALGAHVTYGLEPYITTRYDSADLEVNVNPIDPVISLIQFTRLYINRDFNVYAFVDDESSDLDVIMQYVVNGGSEQELCLNDDGTGNDLIAGDRIYTGFLSAPLNSPGTFEFRISATDDDLNTSFEPSEGMYLINIAEPSDIDLSINEIMASNSSVIRDNFNEYDDWIEIYNQGADAVWLGDKHLSDDMYNPSKWQMPNIEIVPGEFMLFWADGDTEQGEFHTSFKLSKDGEEIGIYDSYTASYAEVDYFSFGLQETDISIGRIPDGTGPVDILPWSTPGYTNEGDPYVSINETISGAKVYPNPFYEYLNVQFSDERAKDVHIFIYDLSGKIIIEKNFNNSYEKIQLNEKLSQLKSGTYLLSVLTNHHETPIYKIIIKQ